MLKKTGFNVFVCFTKRVNLSLLQAQGLITSTQSNLQQEQDDENITEWLCWIIFLCFCNFFTFCGHFFQTSFLVNTQMIIKEQKMTILRFFTAILRPKRYLQLRLALRHLTVKRQKGFCLSFFTLTTTTTTTIKPFFFINSINFLRQDTQLINKCKRYWTVA